MKAILGRWIRLLRKNNRGIEMDTMEHCSKDLQKEAEKTAYSREKQMSYYTSSS